jgi:uncharacterized membrane protein HdeD (DUF308 family)
MSASLSSRGAPPAGASAESKWWVILHGVMAILFGLAILAWPNIARVGLLLAFGVFAIAAGIFAFLEGLHAEEGRRRWLSLAAGVVSVLAGLMALAWPAITAPAFLYLLAAWAIVTGMLEMAGAFRTRLAATVEWVLMVSGIISVVFGILLLVWPRLSMLALVWLIGIFAIAYGILHLVLAFTEGLQVKPLPSERMKWENSAMPRLLPHLRVGSKGEGS